MTMSEQGVVIATARAAPIAEAPADVAPGNRYVQWGPAFCGAVIAAAAFFVLMTFATAIGLAVTSVSPTWRDTSVGLSVLSGAWMVLSAIGSFALGGYIAGRARSRWEAPVDEIHFRDGLHGLLTWGLAIIFGVALTWAGAATLTLAAKPNATAAPSSARTNEPGFLAFELDRLFRSDRLTPVTEADRSEAGRIIETTLGHQSIAPDDYNYLVRLVSARTGLAQADAEKRTLGTLAEAHTAASRARHSAVILGFTLAAALAAAAAAAWGAAREGGRQRDENVGLPMNFGWGRRRVI
jgi:hypothetical protein